MAKRKTKGKAVKTRKAAKAVRTRKAAARRTVKTTSVKANVFNQPLTALQNSVSSFIGYFK